MRIKRRKAAPSATKPLFIITPHRHAQVSGLPALSEYVDRATSSIFATPAPQRVPMHQVEEGAEGTSGQGSSSWSDAAKVRGSREGISTSMGMLGAWWWLFGVASHCTPLNAKSK